MPILTQMGLPIKSIQFLAPAIRTDLFAQTLLPHIRAGALPLPSSYLLSDALERADTVGPYGKSLLYLVSNAFEGRRGVSLLGLQRCGEEDPALRKRFSGQTDGRPALVVAGSAGPAGSRSGSRSHGGFDNDPQTMNSVLTCILDAAPKRLFTARELKY